MKLQKSPLDEFVVYYLLEAPNREAVEMNHAKLGYKCDWITEIKTMAE